jgi:sialic acid synthase SpsE
LPVGYSDHTKFNLGVLKTAWLLGAEVIEKLFTLDKTLKGNDHYHAASPEDLRNLIKEFRYLLALIAAETPTYYEPSEEESRRNARRGVYIVRDVSSGEPMSAEDAIFLRPQICNGT